MVRFAGRMLTVVALQALAIACVSEPHQPGPPASVPAPAAIPPVSPSLPPLPSPDAPIDPTQQDSGGVKHPWPSGPIAAL